MPFRSSTAHRRAWSEPGRDEPLGLESIERRVDGAGRDITVEAMLNLLQDGSAVGFLPEFRPRSEESQQDGLLERAKVLSQNIYIVDIFASASTESLATDGTGLTIMVLTTVPETWRSIVERR